ncbi:MAG: alginate lyase family protein [Terracidiphilus sp.]
MPFDMRRLSRREFNGFAAAAGLGLLAPLSGWSAEPQSFAFIHPGILHTQADLDRMRAGVSHGRAPVEAGFAKLRENRFSQPDYAPHPFGEEIARNPSVNEPAFDDDANAAYQCSLIAAITGDERYSMVARSIVLGWSGSLQRVSGADAVLMAGLGPFKFVSAAEILRAIGELDSSGAAQCAAMLRRTILPTLIDFAPFANGNWDTAAMKTMLAIAVFSDDRPLFERALLYYLHGDGDGRLTHYIYENGQCQESGRDQQHTQLGIAHMGDACEIAWHQGIDLYGAEDNRLLRGFEYTATYNLGGEVEFLPDVDRTGKYRHSVISPRSTFRPIYEQILAHYHGRRGLPAPAVARVVEKIRPEGAFKGADHTGFGTLLYATEDTDRRRRPWPVAPGAVFAEAKDAAVELSWVTPRKFSDCLVERAVGGGGFRRIRSGIHDGRFRDTAVKQEMGYVYRITAGESEPFSQAVRIVTGLPRGWRDGALGEPSIAGNVQYDGRVLTIDSSGAGLMRPADEGHFVAAAPGCTALTARFVPQIASQFAMFGLGFRRGFGATAPSVALLIAPVGTGRRGWQIRLLARGEDGQVQAIADIPLGESAGTYGRLLNPVWFHMQRSERAIRAQFSFDGSEWRAAGEAGEFEGGALGIAASSGIVSVDGSVRFDSLATQSE